MEHTFRNRVAASVHAAVAQETGTDGWAQCQLYAIAGAALLVRLGFTGYRVQASAGAFSGYHAWIRSPAGEVIDLAARHHFTPPGGPPPPLFVWGDTLGLAFVPDALQTARLEAATRKHGPRLGELALRYYRQPAAGCSRQQRRAAARRGRADPLR
jgi:hypothetical protein